MLVYPDSMILIYYLDSIGAFQVLAATRLALARSRGDRLAVSDLTRLECRVTPMRRQAAATLVKFDDFFALPDVERIPLSAAVLDRATAIRANYSYKTLDAIHLAAAVEAGCGVFLTNDSRLHGFPDIAVEVLQ